MLVALTNRIAMPLEERLRSLLVDWGQDWANFLRHEVPKIVLVIAGAVVLTRTVRVLTRGMTALQSRRLPPGCRAQQLQTLAAVINRIGTFVILFVATLQILPLLGLNLGPVLASAGIAGLAIGFGAQTLVRDFINGFFVLLEDQYNIGDTVRLAGVKGTVENMTLRRTELRDDDGTVHIIPNSQVQIVSNMTRDWAQVALHVSVAYSEPTDKIITVLKQDGDDSVNDPACEQDILADVQDVLFARRIMTDVVAGL